MKEIQDFDNIMIKLASPEQIRAWSYGEVKKPETINYRTLRPERDGLFCEKIFGTTKEWECYCGKFKSIRYKGVICDRCGVEVTHFKVRRERMGHIDLASPVSHIWYYRSVPSRMSLLLDIPRTSLQSILYYEKYVVTNPGETELKYKQMLTEEEYYSARDQFGESFQAMMGAEAVKVMLENLDLEELSTQLREQMLQKGDKADKRLLKRIEVVENFRDSGNRPEWMILTVIPVIPPELRPMVQLDGGRFATSDLNDLYRRVINRNNRLTRLMALHAPDIIIRNEKRMLQEAVDALFDNSKKKRVVKGASNRPLKSLSDMLKGKQGRFRQNLLGKRVDYSGRSVIVVGPELRLHQCGLPAKMALELYKPFIMKKLVQKGIVYNIKKAKTLVEQETPEVWAILDDVVKEHPVLLNRAPTLHRLGIQAFEPVLVDGKAIKLHPLVCHAYNADFDGDQMAVHVPLTQAAQIECWTLMLSATNLLDPANGKPIVFPAQDMVLGINYLTREMANAKGTGKFFDSLDEILLAIEVGSLSYNALIKYRLSDGNILETTPGRVIFNAEMPPEIGYQNVCFGDKELKRLVGEVIKTQKSSVAVKMLDSIKDIGFKYATLFGATIGLSDMIIPEAKKELVTSAEQRQMEIRDQYRQGHITQDERYNRVIEVWSKTTEEISSALMDELKTSQNGFNPLYLMADSGARGSKTQIRQLGGMRGLMAKPSGDIIEFPIRSNFREGLSIIEFFISTNGARKGLADTALKTAEAGYLTRRLVDIAQDVVINEDDCGTINGIERTAMKDGDEIVESLAERIIGRFTLEKVKHPITGELIVDVNQEITGEIANKIEESGIETVAIRTVLTCEAKHGVCRKCYGRNLATNRPVEIGEAVGIIAAQSIGQPGTQLTMRTFHIGGTATSGAEENRLTLGHPAVINSIYGTLVETEDKTKLFTRKGYIKFSRVLASLPTSDHEKILVHDGDRVFHGAPLYQDKKGKLITAHDVGIIRLFHDQVLLVAQEQKLDIRNGSELKVHEDMIVPAGDAIVVFDPFSEPIIAEFDGKIQFVDIKLGTTLKEEVNAETGSIEKKITDHISETLQPRIMIIGEDQEALATYHLPASSYLNIEDGVKVKKGRILAKLLKESIKTKDITGGLPRVGELFEARRPKNPSVLSKVEGVVKFGSVVKGKRVVVVEDDFGHEFKHLVPMSKHMLVRDGDRVEAAERLCDGPIDPHDILDILGENALQSFLLDEVQEVYRLQGVDINDKHLGVVVRQMLRKVEVINVGDTGFIQGQQVDKYRFHEENARVIREGGQPADARPMLLGITRASLSIDSFISAASFQETTKVLTNAAIAGSRDVLRGLKENVIIGHLIPAGTGMKRYRSIKVKEENPIDLGEKVQSIMGLRRSEMYADDDDFEFDDLGETISEGEVPEEDEGDED
ncbi:MAG: DNA-directed RNA polymerase subunit beta' [Sphaerochaetaceae bacterium]|jgi:DNA-directed RNA polymerase subunit beta'|nr:DNA-directed RNA polymerase subunit beta' [Sphaerochaetaceae bacterium]NLO59773.1 DNA-directed RNA polymerase subunit beta' [Spirochaetales bacterium]MDD2405581.1 DNA-directed RNA polymerase subunit beta' [Sphaerochaetaceae bacterium]MDD4258850.1 DNA-directed RNA polymerase subunit beta' [Sphaerochaetaceae bacterium]MDD4840617.1 DNA-directed RNA polymerase subunit beta' [Sphaerochaetaceae bacterium]